MYSIRLEAVNKTYIVNKQRITALQQVSFAVEAGEIFGIIGYSGAGKSTLIRLINLLEKPDSGTIFIDNTNITELNQAALRSLRQQIGMIFQHFNLLSSRTVAENIRLPLELVGVLSKFDQDARVVELLKLVGLHHLANHYPRQLSGGQKQRVGIARALANRPGILLCDEATNSLDPQTTHDILDLIAKINRKFHLTVVLITHEMDIIRRVADKVAVLDKGCIIEMGSVLQCFLRPQKTVTRRMIGQLQHTDELIESGVLHNIQGQIWRLTFIGKTTSEPFLNKVAKQFDVQFSLLQGSVAKLKNAPYGQLVLELKGSDKTLQLVKAYFEANLVTVEIILPQTVKKKGFSHALGYNQY
ncbi:MAG: ATP-binding cassette domain-containing protein [Neisseriales bacterium]|nr:MAG: ATP-binding cassette domain-containing protein [Neisseriales bacterium]